MPRGRPAVKPSVSLTLWLMVELMRDRKERGRASARDASDRVAKHLAEHFRGGVVPTAETVRRHYKQFERVMRRGGDEAERAKRLLDAARHNRALLAPETSLWVPVFVALGCVVVLTPE